MRVNLRGTIAGLFIVAIGVLWILQGTDSLGQQGGMNGDENWTLIGSLAVLAGLGVVFWTNRSRV